MPDRSQEEGRIRQYLLGFKLPEGEEKQFEARYFEDDEYVELISDVELQLIDDYLEDNLPGHERAQFESVYLGLPRRRRRVALILSLREATRLGEGGIPNGNVFVQTLHQELASIAVHRADEPADKNWDWSFPFLALTPSVARGAETETRTVILRPETRAFCLLLLLKFEPETRSCRSVVETSDGDVIWEQDGLIATRQEKAVMIEISLPADVFKAGDYLLTLSAADEHGQSEILASYPFAVERPNPS
jgi:hypothetical protein